jgi:hypothetical protein
VNLLLEAGADVNMTDKAGRTPLDYAWAHGNATSAKVLSARGGRAAVTPAPVDTAALLRKPLAPGESTVWYLAHSGWAVKTQTHLLIFDYIDREKLPDEPGLANGFINPARSGTWTWWCSAPMSTATITTRPFLAGGKIFPASPTSWVPTGKQTGTPSWNPGREDRRRRETRHHRLHRQRRGLLGRSRRRAPRSLGDHANRQDELEKPFTDGIDFLAARGLKAEVLFAPVSGCNFQNKKGLTRGVYYSIAQLQPKMVFPMHGNENEVSYTYFAGEAKAAGVKTRWICAGNCGDAWRLTAADCTPAVP